MSQSLNRDTWKINRRRKQIDSPNLKDQFRPRKQATPKLGANVEFTVEARKAKKDDVVRYHGRICKITYVNPDKTVNLSAFKGAPFNSKFTPIADLEFAHEDGSFAVMDVEPEVTVIAPAPAPKKPRLEIKPKTTVQGDQFLMPMSKFEAQTLVNQIRSDMNTMAGKLLQLKEREGWKALGYANWRECVTKEFDFEQSRAYRLLALAEVTRNLSPIGENVPMPSSESQVRPIAGLSAEQQREAWVNATKANNGEVPTAKQVEQAADHLENSPQTESPAATLSEETAAPITSPSTGRQKPKENRTSTEESPLFDRCQTPPYALIPLIPYIDPSWHVWEPAAGKGRLVQALVPHVANVSASDILTGEDFLRSDRTDFDAIVTNPPYSRKYHWLAHCYKLGKPFALLIPGESLFTKQAATYIERFGIELVIPLPRIDFEMPNLGFEGDGAKFPTAWFTWNFGIGRPFTYVDISKEKKAFKESLS